MKSILQSEKKCYFCQREYGLHEHHIFEGTANRQVSENNGFKVWLCGFHHNESEYGVHGAYGDNLREELHKNCEKKYLELGHTREEFIKLIGQDFLERRKNE